MAEFKSISPNTQYLTGDVLRIKSDYWLIDHYAIVFSRNGKQYVAEGVPEGIQVELLSDYVKRRTMTGLLRDKNTALVTDQNVIDKIDECGKKEWKLFGFNCEDFVAETCNCDIGLIQKHKWHISGWALVIAGILGYFIFKKIWGILVGILIVGLVILIPRYANRIS